MIEKNNLKEDLKKAFSNLNLDQKRNEFNSEIRVISAMINSLLVNYGEKQLFQPYNYKTGVDKDLSETDILIQNYMDILEIKNNLILLLSYLTKK